MGGFAASPWRRWGGGGFGSVRGVTVRDGQNEGIDGLRAQDFSLVIPGQSTPSNLATLVDSFPDVWGPFTDADAGNGVYKVVLRAEPGSYTYTDIAALGVEIDPSLEVANTDG